ncbi:hypothetical protein D3C71_955030 [compost metagenome]
MRHAGHQIDKAHRVADGGLLLSERLMRLAVGFIFDHPGRAVVMPVRGFAAFFIFDIVKMWLRTALFDEILHQRQIA